MAPTLSRKYFCHQPKLYIDLQNAIANLNLDEEIGVKKLKKKLLHSEEVFNVFKKYIEGNLNYKKWNNTPSKIKQSCTDLAINLVEFISTDFDGQVYNFLETPLQDVCAHAALMAHLRFCCNYFGEKESVTLDEFKKGKKIGEELYKVLGFKEDIGDPKIGKKKNALRSLMTSNKELNVLVFDKVYEKSERFTKYDYQNIHRRTKTIVNDYIKEYQGHSKFNFQIQEDPNAPRDEFLSATHKVYAHDDLLNKEDLEKKEIPELKAMYIRYHQRICAIQVNVADSERKLRERLQYVSNLEKPYRNQMTARLKDLIEQEKERPRSKKRKSRRSISSSSSSSDSPVRNKKMIRKRKARK